MNDPIEINGGAVAGSSPVPCSVSSVRREVIENKLLDALTDEGTVAMLLSESDLKALIAACEYYDLDRHFAVLQDMGRDLEQLLQSAFPQNA